MRTLVCALLLCTAAFGQVNVSASTQAPPFSSSKAQKEMVQPLGAGVELASSAKMPPAEALQPGAAAVVQPAPANSGPVPANADQHAGRNQRLWYSALVVEHGAAAFDSWSTREAMSTGRARELDPLMRPFANSAAIYPALQVLPSAMDYLGWRMMHSRHPLYRKLWWVPQIAVTAGSFYAGAANLQVANR